MGATETETTTMRHFIQRIETATTVADLRAVVHDAVASDLTHDELRAVGAAVAERTFALTLAGRVAA